MLVGFPCRLHYICKNDQCEWITAELLDAYVKDGWTVTSETKMGYALPEWFKNIDPDKPTIMNLDDSQRALSHILQGIYELIYKQELWSFKLPPKTTIMLTNNPDNGDYTVNSWDEAASSRMINFNIKWDIDAWAAWAENAQLDSRAINFLLSYHTELIKDDDTHHHIMNARSYTLFANTISGIDNWETQENLALILQIASGCFDDKDNIVGRLFTTFISRKLDKLISPKDMLLKSWDTIKHQIKSSVYDSAGNYRPDIASILHTRLLNYTMYYFEQKGAKTDVVVNRLLDLINAPEEKDTNGEVLGMLFSEDFLFDIIRTLNKKYPSRTNKLMLNKKIRSKVM